MQTLWQDLRTGSHAEEESRIHGRRGADAGIGHWGQRRGFSV